MNHDFSKQTIFALDDFFSNYSQGLTFYPASTNISRAYLSHHWLSGLFLALTGWNLSLNSTRQLKGMGVFYLNGIGKALKLSV